MNIVAIAHTMGGQFAYLDVKRTSIYGHWSPSAVIISQSHEHCGSGKVPYYGDHVQF